MVKQDVSKQTVVVLVFLAILVTLLGTLTVMSEVSKIRGAVPGPQSNTNDVGVVTLRIAGEQVPTQSQPAVGQVSLTIAPNNQG